MLTEIAIRAAKPAEKAWQLFDERGQQFSGNRSGAKTQAAAMLLARGPACTGTA